LEQLDVSNRILKHYYGKLNPSQTTEADPPSTDIQQYLQAMQFLENLASRKENEVGRD